MDRHTHFHTDQDESTVSVAESGIPPKHDPQSSRPIVSGRRYIGLALQNTTLIPAKDIRLRIHHIDHDGWRGVLRGRCTEGIVRGGYMLNNAIIRRCGLYSVFPLD
jgi:hypothetical protein